MNQYITTQTGDIMSPESLWCKCSMWRRRSGNQKCSMRRRKKHRHNYYTERHEVATTNSTQYCVILCIKYLFIFTRVFRKRRTAETCGFQQLENTLCISCCYSQSFLYLSECRAPLAPGAIIMLLKGRGKLWHGSESAIPPLSEIKVNQRVGRVGSPLISRGTTSQMDGKI